MKLNVLVNRWFSPWWPTPWMGPIYIGLGMVAAVGLSLTMLLAPATASAINPVDCAFNPAVAKMHPKECKGITVEDVASNGGPADIPVPAPVP